MSPFIALISLAVLVGSGVFVVGLVMRKRKVILLSLPAVVLLGIWLILASSRPNPQKEFDRLFGAANRELASDIQTIKPMLMDGHFISFRIHPADFDDRVRSQFSKVRLGSTSSILLGQPLPSGWPAAIETTDSALHREVDHDDVYLLYFPSQEIAYASVRYDQW